MRFLAKAKLSEHKYKTPEGYLVCVDAVLSRTGKQQYRRAELFGDSCERADELIDVDRLEVDVFDEKAMASFENKPICVEHPDEDVNVANHNDLAVGFVRDIKRGIDNGQPVMLGTLVITDENAIDLVESGEYNELSCGYDCDIADDEHPTQKNIRGNHVALCQHGRAGNARIVDSVNDEWTQARFEELIDEAETKRELDLVISLMTSKKSDTIWQSADAYRKLVEKADTKKHALADSKVSDVADLSGLYKNDDGDAIKVIRNGFSYDVRFGEDTIFNNGWSFSRSYDSTHLLKYLRQNEFTKVSKFDYLKDSKMKDANYEQWTKQGWRVVALYKDGGRIHAIVERKSGDFVVALGYNTSTGEWAQGRYVSTFAAAVDTLNEEKPGAVPIRDAKSTKKMFEVSFVKDGVTYIRKVRANDLQDAIVKAKDEASTAHKVVVFTQNMLSEMGKNNSLGKYDKVISAMRQLFGQSFLPDDKLKEVIKRELPRLLAKYVNE